MVRVHRSSTIGVLIVCLLAVPFTSTLAASEPSDDAQPSTAVAPVSASLLRTLSAEPPAAALDVPLGMLDPVAGDHWQASHVAFAPTVDTAAIADGGQYGRRSRGRRNGAAAAVIALGAVASITGAAVLVYANRPECTTNQFASGCGYGTKVVGGAVLSAGVVGIVAGALAWR